MIDQCLKPGPALLCIAALVGSTGCATLFSGTTQRVTVKTPPGGYVATYDGKRIRHNEIIEVEKTSATPEFRVDYGSYEVAQTMDYKADPWLIGDALLLIPFVVPGIIAFAVDFSSGAWRQLETEQVIQVGSTPVTSRGATGSRSSRSGSQEKKASPETKTKPADPSNGSAAKNSESETDSAETAPELQVHPIQP